MVRAESPPASAVLQLIAITLKPLALNTRAARGAGGENQAERRQDPDPSARMKKRDLDQRQGQRDQKERHHLDPGLGVSGLGAGIA